MALSEVILRGKDLKQQSWVPLDTVSGADAMHQTASGGSNKEEMRRQPHNLG